MLNPRLTNCSEDPNLISLINKMDCTISLLSHGLYINTVYILGEYTKKQVISDLLHYKRILEHKSANIDYASSWTVGMIVSKITKHISGCINPCDEIYALAHQDCCGSTTTTTTVVPIYPTTTSTTTIALDCELTADDFLIITTTTTTTAPIDCTLIEGSIVETPTTTSTTSTTPPSTTTTTTGGPISTTSTTTTSSTTTTTTTQTPTTTTTTSLPTTSLISQLNNVFEKNEYEIPAPSAPSVRYASNSNVNLTSLLVVGANYWLQFRINGVWGTAYKYKWSEPCTGYSCNVPTGYFNTNSQTITNINAVQPNHIDQDGNDLEIYLKSFVTYRDIIRVYDGDPV